MRGRRERSCITVGVAAAGAQGVAGGWGLVFARELAGNGVEERLMRQGEQGGGGLT